MMKATDSEILAAYDQAGSVWAAGKLLGMAGQTVHERLVKLGKSRPIRIFTDGEKEFLRGHYAAYANSGKLDDLSAQMGRTKHFLCRQARALGLTDPKRGKPYVSTWKYLSEEAASVIWDDFKSSKYGLGAYCKRKGYDDLGFSKRMRELFGDEYDHVIELKAPKNSLYRHGRQFEYRVRDHFKAAGYFVMRSPQSKSPVDLVAISSGLALMIQCKRAGALPVAEWNALFDLAGSVGSKPILAIMDHERGRGLKLYELTDRKDGTKRRQPMVPFHV